MYITNIFIPLVVAFLLREIYNKLVITRLENFVHGATVSRIWKQIFLLFSEMGIFYYAYDRNWKL